MFGGVEWFLRTLARNASHAPWMTTEFALCFDARIANDLRHAGATVHMLGAVRLRSWRSVRAARLKLLDTLRAGAYDVVICHSAWPHAIFAPVVRRHGSTLVQFMHDIPNPSEWIDHLANQTTPDLVLCNTRFMETAGPWWFPTVRRRMVRYPVPLVIGNDKDESTAARARMRESLEAAPDSVVILHASRMQEWKGHRLLIQSLGELRDNSRWTCWIAGGAQRPSEISYERSLQDDVARLGLTGRVKFLGHRSDMPAVMKAADIYCQANVSPEPFGVAFLEALAAGLPIVTTAMGGPLEIVDDRCGVLVPVDARSISGALGKLIDDDARRALLSKGAPVRAREMCDVETRMRELATTLSNLGLQPKTRRAASYGARARLTSDAVLPAVVSIVGDRVDRFETVVDLGCGRGDCVRYLEGRYGSYIGGDRVKSRSFPRADGVTFRQLDLDHPPYPFEDASANLVVSSDSTRYRRDPRALIQEMARIARPGGWVVVSTPNPARVTSELQGLFGRRSEDGAQGLESSRALRASLAEQELRSIVSECGLVDADVRYARGGHVAVSGSYWPSLLGVYGQWFSKNLLVVARRR
jgi:glycosyltransferase involved in cell wall biosynthesis